MFFGRTQEVQEIKTAIASPKFEAIMLYGRRRVGKKEIIKQSVKDNDILTIHFEYISYHDKPLINHSYQSFI